MVPGFQMHFISSGRTATCPVLGLSFLLSVSPNSELMASPLGHTSSATAATWLGGSSRTHMADGSFGWMVSGECLVGVLLGSPRN
jgi:hypothetical protein